MRIIYSPEFEESYRRIMPNQQNLVAANLALFQKEPLARRFRSRPLTGEYGGLSVAELDLNHCVIFETESPGIVLHWIGRKDLA